MTTEVDPKVTEITYTLPRGVIIEKDGKRHALNKARLREISGKEEDIIADPDVGLTDTVNRVVGNCIIELYNDQGDRITDKEKIDHLLYVHPTGLLLGDVLYSVLKLKNVTLGDQFMQKIECQHCRNDKEKFLYSWTHIGSVNDFEMIPCKGDATEYCREYKTSRGNVITWEMLTVAKETEYMNKFKQSKNKNIRSKTKDDTNSKLATLSLLMRVTKLNGETATVEDLQSLPLKERMEIRNIWDEEGGIDTMFDVVCENCGAEFKVSLDMNSPSFFSLSEM